MLGQLSVQYYINKTLFIFKISQTVRVTSDEEQSVADDGHLLRAWNQVDGTDVRGIFPFEVKKQNQKNQQQSTSY